MNQSAIAYISFDTVPAPKGAAIHIGAFARSLAAAYSQIQLVTVSPTPTAIGPLEIWPGVIQTALPAIGETLIHRVLYFRTMLASWLSQQEFEIIQIRSIYEGFPIALHKHRYCHYLVFEVNGLPSIELKYRYPGVIDDRDLLHKLQAQEQICLNAADLIVTPSTVTRDYLQTRGISPERICVIPNGVETSIFTYFPPKLPTNKGLQMLYFGTLSAWQGVNLAIEALALANRDFPTELTVIGLGRTQQIDTLTKLASKLCVLDKITFLAPMSQEELVEYIHTADVIIAPLTPNDRNLVQGCCPLKILEAMATGTPVISSDLPVVVELGENGVHFLLVKPGSSKGIKDALLRLRSEPELAKNLSVAARQQVENYYTWKRAGSSLITAYEKLGIKRSITF